MIVVGVSWGNDSVALVQFLRELGAPAHHDVVCLYNDTGWAMPAVDGEEAWMDRVARCERWAQSLGFRTSRTASVGMRQLVLDHRGWPRQGMQFCTEDLKIGPALRWLEERDPKARALCVNGKRRAEGLQRAATAEWVARSPLHGGRLVWQPLYAHGEADRNSLITRAGFAVLPHKSRECMLCINTNREGLRRAPEVALAYVEALEAEAGFTHAGKPRTMFRPARKMGATGIREVRAWALAQPGQYRKGEANPLDDGTGPNGEESGCTAGFCETE
jgi:hypothetical protein